MEDREVREYRLQAFEEDKRVAAESRKEQLEKRYMSKVYLGTPEVRAAAYRVDQQNKSQRLTELNQIDYLKLEQLHFPDKAKSIHVANHESKDDTTGNHSVLLRERFNVTMNDNTKDLSESHKPLSSTDEASPIKWPLKAKFNYERD